MKAKRDPSAPLLGPVSYHPRKLGDNDVQIKISHCGICASDIHTATEGLVGRGQMTQSSYCIQTSMPVHQIYHDIFYLIWDN